jgi:thiamine-phosphate pyrophosphorylase
MDTERERRERLRGARLYLVTESERDGRSLLPVVEAALQGGADLVQLRDKGADDESLLQAAWEFRKRCDERGALFVLNDRPDLARAVGADAVHVGQRDAPVEAAREEAGPGVLVGISTHDPDQLAAAVEAEADYLCAGPVWETPTKPGRPAAGLEYVRHAAKHAGELPWFAIGGIDAGNVAEVVAAGAGRIVVVRAVRDARDPRAAAAALRTAVVRGDAVRAA